MIKRFLDKSRKAMSNNRGFTLIEILVVILIIGILFVAFLPRIDFAGDKARETNVKTDLRSYLIASEQLMKEQSGLVNAESGRDIDVEETVKQYNLLLDESVKVGSTDAGLLIPATTYGGKAGVTTAVSEAGSGEFLLNLQDPWKTNYTVEFAKGNDKLGTERKIIIKSYGKNLISSDKNPDFILVTQYVDGQVTTCTAGLNTNIGKLAVASDEAALKTAKPLEYEGNKDKKGFLVPASEQLNCK